MVDEADGNAAHLVELNGRMSSPPPLTAGPIMAGTRFGVFEVIERLGVGGMGEVYRARDTRLERDVALKLLPGDVLDERLARFEREARVVASLNHPNIAALYGVEDSGDVPLLVLELVTGETLAERLASGPLPLGVALAVCRQIAQGLEAAHERGVVHRDLKPSNVKLSPEGKVKILDFGLAKVLADEGRARPLSHSTLSYGDSLMGLMLGTPSYMSPEQVRGQPGDRQMDVWAFGCVLYETLTGRKAFEGPTVSDAIAGVLGQDPDWSALPESVPSRIRDLLRRCLRRDKRRRLHDIADARIELEEVLEEHTDGSSGRRRSPWGRWIGDRTVRWSRSRTARGIGSAIALIAAGALGWLVSRPAAAVPRVARVQVGLPAEAPLVLDRQPSLALSPDGTRLAFVAARGSHAQILVRRLDQEGASPVPGTEGGSSPFFSPDGEWLGFLAEGRLKKVPAAGGQAQPLVEAPALHGASWGEDGSILFAPSSESGLELVPAGGGEPRAVTAPESRTGESSHRWPELLPGARAALFVIHGPGSEEPRIGIVDLRSGQRRVLVEGGTFPRYLPTGHVVFARGEALMVAAFDLRSLELEGTPAPAVQGLTVSPMSGAAHFAVARDGTLAYVPGGVLGARTLLWVDRQGAAHPVTEERRAYVSPDLSSDGQRVAVAIEGDQGLDIWTHDLTRGSLTRLTSDTGNEVAPVWTADGRAVSYGSPLEGPMPGLLSRPADGSGEVRRLFAGGRRHVPGSWSPDGRFLAFTDQDPTPGSTGNDILVLSREEGGRVHPFLKTKFDEAGPMFSPAGRYLAFTSNETGRDEVYVRPFPGPGGKWQISTEGGSEPRWSPSGEELFFRSGGRMMVVSVSTLPSFRASRPRLLFEGPYDPGVPARPNYAVSRDGHRFLMIRSVQPPAPTRLNLVLGWFAELPARTR